MVLGIVLVVVCMVSFYLVIVGFVLGVFEMCVWYFVILLLYQVCGVVVGGLMLLVGIIFVQCFYGEWWLLVVFYMLFVGILLVCIVVIDVCQCGCVIVGEVVGV